MKVNHQAWNHNILGLIIMKPLHLSKSVNVMDSIVKKSES